MFIYEIIFNRQVEHSYSLLIIKVFIFLTHLFYVKYFL